ncbi:MAG: hypothetical protein JW986_01150 [Methanotrichaceae archaeon]|nr:hypothetical protein [Methanotrichaceae archaeon]
MIRYEITARMIMEHCDLLGPDLEGQGIRDRGTLGHLVELIDEGKAKILVGLDYRAMIERKYGSWGICRRQES